MHIALLLLALLGHVFLWAAIVNRMHGRAMPIWAINTLTLLSFAVTMLIPACFGVWFLRAGLGVLDPRGLIRVPWPAGGYLVVCWTAAMLTIARWIWRHVLHRPPAVLRFDRTQLVDLVRSSTEGRAGRPEHHFLAGLPGNEILRLHVSERILDVPRLRPALDELSIIHMSDFHFTGLVGKVFFEELVELSNQMAPDVVAITGDLIDNPECLAWIPDTLGKLIGRYGVYFVLGNHDQRMDVVQLRRTLTECGLVDLGGRWLEIPVRGESIVMAGNELPWLPPAADMRGAPPPSADGGPLRILLSHSPDQIHWAQAHDFDLMLAGHTHGGQIRFPLIGPILSPSRLGVHYASGTFYAPPTIMHVTRGVSGQFPVRVNCPPEIAELRLRTGGMMDDE